METSKESYLNDYVVNHIFSYLSHTDNLQCRLVSKRWNYFATSNLTFSHGCFTSEQLALFGLPLAEVIPNWSLCLFHSSQIQEAIEIATQCGSSVRKLHYIEAPPFLPYPMLLPPPQSLFPNLVELSLSLSSSPREPPPPSSSTSPTNYPTLDTLRTLSIQRIDKSGIKFTIDLISAFPKLQELQLDYKLSKKDSPSHFLSELAAVIPPMKKLTTLRFTDLWGGSHSSYDSSHFFLHSDDLIHLAHLIRNLQTLELPSLWLTFDLVSTLQRECSSLNHLTSLILRSVYFEHKPDSYCHRVPNGFHPRPTYSAHGTYKLLPFKETDFLGFSSICPNLKKFRVTDEGRAALKFPEDTNCIHPILKTHSETFHLLSSSSPSLTPQESLQSLSFGTDCVIEKNKVLSRIASTFPNLTRLKISIARGFFGFEPVVVDEEKCLHKHHEAVGDDVDVTLGNILKTLSALVNLRFLEVFCWRPLGLQELTKNLLQVELFKSLSYRLAWADEVRPFTRQIHGEIALPPDCYYYNRLMQLRDLYGTHTVILDGFSCKKSNRSECRDVNECGKLNKFIQFCRKSHIPIFRDELLNCPTC